MEEKSELTPKLKKINDTIYGCSACTDWTVTIEKPHKLTRAQWQRRLDNYFAEHLSQRHSGDEVTFEGR